MSSNKKSLLPKKNSHSKKKRRRSNNNEGGGEREESPTKKPDREEEASSSSSSDSESDDEEELLAAAGAWAAQEKPQAKKKRQETSLSSSEHHDEQISAHETPKKWSVHITQIAFTASEFDIREHFSSQGCMITSLRMVLDKDADGGKRLFRGVAFIDLEDKDSYEAALKLDKSKLLGRKINVRPTKTEGELANIVKRTKELVAEKVQKTKEKGKLSSSKQDTKDKGTKQPKEKKFVKDPNRKLTKKERNRKAAIILNRKRKRAAQHS